jgi:hypothetical protein
VSSLKRIFAVAMMAPLLLVTMIVTHEAGHTLTAKVLAGVNAKVYIWPGYELYPDLGKKPAPDVHLKGLAMTHIVARGDAFPWKRLNRFENYILLMGSGLTQLLSLASLCALTMMKTRDRPLGMWGWLLPAGGLLHIDMLTYAVFPLFNLQHLVFWGGVSSEPLIALGRFGLAQYIAVPAVIFLSLMQLFWLYQLSRPTRAHKHLRNDNFAKMPVFPARKNLSLLSQSAVPSIKMLSREPANCPDRSISRVFRR